MEQELKLTIILEKPVAGAAFGLQKGKGNDYETVQTQMSNGNNLLFDLNLRVKMITGEVPVFLGPFAQGPASDRFIYIDIGTLAGQKNSIWTRRLKIPLTGITVGIVNQLLADSKLVLETTVPGTGKDGGPNCATVKPFAGWKLVKAVVN
ncbi:MAG: DUF5990 family protein [Ferruginibacter sp.]